MFSHIMVGSNDIERSKSFYDALFNAMGAKPGMQDEKGVNYRHNGAMLMVRPPLNGETASHGNGSTIGFNLNSPERVSAWHDAGVAAGDAVLWRVGLERAEAGPQVVVDVLEDPHLAGRAVHGRPGGRVGQVARRFRDKDAPVPSIASGPGHVVFQRALSIRG